MVTSMAFVLTSALPRLAARSPTANVLRLSTRLAPPGAFAGGLRSPGAAMPRRRTAPSMVASTSPNPSSVPSGQSLGARRSPTAEEVRSVPVTFRGGNGVAPPSGRGGGGGGGGEGAGDDSSAAAGRGVGLGALLLRSWNSYVTALETSPIRTKALTAGVLVGLGDALAQALTGTKIGELDIPRLVRFATFGLALQGPVGHMWYNILEKVIRMPGVAGIAGKVAADQLIFAPIFTGVFYAYLCLTEGGQLGDVQEAVLSKLPSTLVTSWKVWPLAHVINFGLVPLGLRVLYANLVNTAWVAFLSMTAAEKAVKVVKL